jgi:hypothetical protein
MATIDEVALNWGLLHPVIVFVSICGVKASADEYDAGGKGV